MNGERSPNPARCVSEGRAQWCQSGSGVSRAGRCVVRRLHDSSRRCCAAARHCETTVHRNPQQTHAHRRPRERAEWRATVIRAAHNGSSRRDATPWSRAHVARWRRVRRAHRSHTRADDAGRRRMMRTCGRHGRHIAPAVWRGMRRQGGQAGERIARTFWLGSLGGTLQPGPQRRKRRQTSNRTDGTACSRYLRPVSFARRVSPHR